jgi:hypothetical protein
MKKLFKELISDNNSLNEQAFVGIVSFFAMVFILFTDVVTGIFGNELVIKSYIFDGFMLLTLGSFGISTVGKVMSKKKDTNDEE